MRWPAIVRFAMPSTCVSTFQKLREVVFPDGHLNKDAVGKTPREISAMAGIDVPASARIILLPAKGAGTANVLAKEKGETA